MRLLVTLLLLVLVGLLPVSASDGNRLAFMSDGDPYYVHGKFPKLTTPQWIGEAGVDAVIVLAIDDMRGHEKWEAYLRPILNRLKKIDGRAPVSIMTCQIDPQQPHLQTWLAEGLSLDNHTTEHPRPIFRGGLNAAKETYDKGVDLLATIPNNRPVAFRMPYCDSLNTPSPRFYAEIFNRTTPNGRFLSIDSSVFNVFTSADPELPRDLVMEGGQERFKKYLPLGASFVNTIENYPYPYVLGGLCWQFPCATPSDWQGQHLNKPNSPITVRDLKASIDCTVAKKGVFSLVFHPHGWISSAQMIELIDHVVEKHGKKVKFLNFREAEERLNKNLLAGQPLRHPKTRKDNGVRVLDLDNDGSLDVVIANPDRRETRLWSPKKNAWRTAESPKGVLATDAHFGVLGSDGKASWVDCDDSGTPRRVFHFDGDAWVPDAAMLEKLPRGDAPLRLDRLRDVDGDGRCEAIFDGGSRILEWTGQGGWKQLPFQTPCRTGAPRGSDDGVRFIDLDGDGHDDIVFSNRTEYGIYLFKDRATGWSRKVASGKAGEPGSLPPIAVDGTNNGFWVHGKQLVWGNESTAPLADHVERRPIAEILRDVPPGPKTPKQSARLLQPRPGFVAELMAAEPLVMDPIAFAWAPDGKLWVVEMGDYPLGVDGRGKHGGVVRILTDTDGDGAYDKSTIFLADLGYPTGVLPWGKGALITCAPDIFYAEDTDGDGKADTREVLYTGFVQGNQQHRVNGPVRGLDNWLYLANGDSGGTIKSLKTGKTLNINGRDLRIKPETGEMEAVSGQTQFGRSRDDWGNWFGGNNANPMWHYVLADEYLRRNPHLASPVVRTPVSITPGAAPVYPISSTAVRFNDPAAANRFTSANSPIVYRDTLFGPEFANNTFVSEPVHNLVHREVMKPDGVTFTSRRADDESRSEFLASADSWFRPAMLQTGPDGALWVADMYRHVIEHPQWIPKDWQQKLDLRAGHDMGRIYRIFPTDAKPRPVPNLTKLDTAGLVAALESPNGWQRDTAQALLVAKGDKAALPALVALAKTSPNPLARLHALCTLDGLLPADGPTSDAYQAALLRALEDAHPGVRKHAVRLCESRLSKSGEYGPALLKLRKDPDAQVRQQLAYSLGAWDNPRAGAALGAILADDAADRNIATAALSSVSAGNLDAVLAAFLEQHRADAKTSPVMADLLRMADSFENTASMATLLQSIATPRGGSYASWQYSALASLLDHLDRRNQSLESLRKKADAKMEKALASLEDLFKEARVRAADDKTPVAARIDAIRILGRDGQNEGRRLAELLTPHTAEEVQKAVVGSLARQRNDGASALLLANWQSHTPGLRTQILDVLLARAGWAQDVLSAVERKEILSAEIDAAGRQRLLEHPSTLVRERAAKVFAGGASSDRKKAIEDYAAALKLKGDASRGGPLFKKTCAACHRVAGAGGEVGPDLAGVADKSDDWLLTAILDPNQAIETRYINYVASLKNGQVLTGVLTSETSTSLTFAGADGQSRIVLRGDVDELKSTGKSAMPDGLEKDLKPQDLADVIAFVRSSFPAAKIKVFEGNTPAVVRPDAKGALLLSASTCEIRGKRLELEKKYGNLGYWMGEDDTATWSIVVPRSAKYAIWLDYACDQSAAGNRIEFQAGPARQTAVVASTGNWDTYRQDRVGGIELTAGEHRLVARSAGPIRGALIDLKSLKLVPEP